MDSEGEHRPSVLEKMAVAFELYDMAERIMRRNLRRCFPDASDAEIHQRLEDWLRERPGAPHGDAEGVPGRWPRSR